jgi:hypothetical protein
MKEDYVFFNFTLVKIQFMNVAILRKGLYKKYLAFMPSLIEALRKLDRPCYCYLGTFPLKGANCAT